MSGRGLVPLGADATATDRNLTERGKPRGSISGGDIDHAVWPCCPHQQSGCGMSESSAWEGSGPEHLHANLQVALRRARVVGMAIGIVMERQRLSEHEAWEALLYTSHRTRRTMRDIATYLIDTGELPPESGGRRPRHR